MAFEGVSWVNIQHSLGSGAGDDDAEHGDDRPSELWGDEWVEQKQTEREKEIELKECWYSIMVDGKHRSNNNIIIITA